MKRSSKSITDRSRRRLDGLEIMARRREGLSWEQIADAMGLSYDTVRAIAIDHLYASQPSTPAERLELRARIAERLTILTDSLLETAMTGDLNATDRLLKAQEQQLRVSELPVVRPSHAEGPESIADSVDLLARRTAQAAANADLSEIPLTTLLSLVGPLVDRTKERTKDIRDDEDADRLRRIASILDAGRTRRAGAAPPEPTDDESDEVQDEDDERL